MSKSLKSPPRFDPDEDNYEQFKKDLEIWSLLTDLEAKKRGPAGSGSCKKFDCSSMLMMV